LRIGADVTGYALEPPTTPGLFEICGLSKKIYSVIGDIRDLPKLSAVFAEAKPEIVVHMAAQPLVIDSYSKPVYTFETNIMGTVNILECVRNSPSVKSFLNVTTDKVYLNLERKEGYREDEKLGGFDPYANSKSCSELVTASYKQSFFNTSDIAISTARSGNVIGGGDFSANRLIPDCAKAAANGESIKIRNPDSVRPYQHVLDTLFAYLLIVQRQYENPALAGSYNIGPDEDSCKTSGELASMFCSEWGNGAKWENVSVDTPHEDNVLKLDCTKILKMLGWSPKWDISQAVGKTSEWYKAYYQDDSAYNILSSQIGAFL
jgi:CDP-glucose 4,6-dehydratase